MNVLFVFGHQLTIGGHFKSGQALIRGLCARGHKVHVIITHGDDRLAAEFKAVGASVYMLAPAFFRGRLSHIELSLWAFKKIMAVVWRQRVDVIHCQDSVFCRAAYLTAALQQKKLVFTQAGGEPIDLGTPAEVPLVVYSPELQEAYEANPRFVGGGGIYYVPQRIDTTIYYPENRDRFRELATSEKPLIKIFMAIRIHPCKLAWLETLFSLAQGGGPFAVPCRIEFTVAGSGPLLEQMRLRAAQVAYSGIVIRFMGPVTNPEEIRKLINQAHFVIGNGRGIMEAMACGCPVIVLGEQGEAELVTAENVDRIAHYNFSGRHLRHAEGMAFASVLWHALQELDKASVYGDFALKYAKENLSHQAGAQKLEEIYINANASKYGMRSYHRWVSSRKILRRQQKNSE